MIENIIIGREIEFERLDQCMNEEESQLVVVYGRRRVGKTYLINQYFNGRFDFKLTGVYDAPKSIQLTNFINELNRQTNDDHSVPETWTQAFTLLRSYLSSLPANEKHVVFFDEMPWMDTQRSDFLPAFEFFWNDFGCTLNNLVFIVCGSATSWIEKNIERSKGSMFNRQTCSLYINPFTLHETEQYLLARDVDWSRYDIAECYMIMGGIPYYLRLIKPSLSLAQNIDNIFFRKRAELWDEFDHLYRTLFNRSHLYIKAVETLSEKRSGMTRTELSKAAGLNDNSDLTVILEDLQASGFVRAYNYFGKKKQDTRYQLADYYSLFYFRFIKNRHGRDEHFWSHTYDNPQRRVWAGLTFEQLCKDHIPQIKRKLGISGILTEESSWFIHPDEDAGIENGAQIDLLIDRRDHVINICEDKFCTDVYEIDKEYSMALRRKADAFRKSTGTKKSLVLTMITTFGIKQNKYSSMINSQVILDDLFAE